MTRWIGIGALGAGLVLVAMTGTAAAGTRADSFVQPKFTSGTIARSTPDKKTLAGNAKSAIRLASKKQIVSADELPAAVMDTVRRAFPDAAVRKAARLTKGSETWYQVALASGKHAKERLAVAADGRLLTSKEHK